MMIRYNHGHAKFSGESNLIGSRNSVIARYDRIDTVVRCFLYQMFIQSISIQYPVRNFMIHHGTKILQPFLQNISRSNSVYVVIAQDADRLFLSDFFCKKQYRALHIRQKKRVRKAGKIPIKILPNVFLSYDITVPDQTRNDRVHSKFRSDGRKIRPFGRNHPAFLLHGILLLLAKQFFFLEGNAGGFL